MTELSAGSIKGKASMEARISAEPVDKPTNTDWYPQLEFEGKKMCSSNSIFNGSPAKAIVASKALLLPPDMDRHRSRSNREVTLLAAKQAAQVTLNVPSQVLFYFLFLFVSFSNEIGRAHV